MKQCLIPILIAVLILTSGVLVGCGGGLQTFSKYDISFEVPRELKLEEYAISIENPIPRKGTATYRQGMVISSEKNFWFLWLERPELTLEEVRLSILSTPDVFESSSGTFRAQITGGLITQRIADFEVTFAEMRFTLPGWEAPGITAVWYCPASQRAMQLVLVNRNAESEMRRFIHSFSC
ncbi:hypothetical protein ES703_124417 [subsurface metagenome]